MLSWGGKGTGATGHRLGTGAFDDDDDDLYKEPRPIRDLMGEEVCQVGVPRVSYGSCRVTRVLQSVGVFTLL